jgi:DNA polymerase-3 subunit epsilon
MIDRSGQQHGGDVLEISHAQEPRDLAAAVRTYCRRDHEGAHAALADVEATTNVLDAMLARHDDLPRTVAGLHVAHAEVDLAGRFRREDGQVVFNFGSYRGRSLDAVAEDDPRYLEWILGADFLDDAKAVVRRALFRFDEEE